MTLKKLLIVLVCYSCMGCEDSRSEKELGIIAIAQKEWLKTFHTDFEDLKPFKVELKDNAWIVSGTGSPNKDGGVPIAVIDATDLHVMDVYHTK